MRAVEVWRWQARRDVDWGTIDTAPYTGRVWRETFMYRGQRRRRWVVAVDGHDTLFRAEYGHSKLVACELAQSAAGLEHVLQVEVRKDRR